MAFGNDVGLLFKVKADTGQASSELNAFTSKADSDITRLTGGASTRFSSLTNVIGGSTGALGGLAGAAGIAVGGLTAIAAAVVGASVGLFNMAASAAEVGSKVYDLTIQTNMSAETLSALKVAAEQGGSSLEAVGKGAVKFTGSLVDAANGSKKLAEALGRFGIDAKTAFLDPDKAMSDFITKFNSLPPSAQKNRDEMLLFKDKTGELIPVFDQVGGSFSEFQDKLETLGLIMSTQEVANADAFGDQLAELGAVASRVGNKFAAEFTFQLTGGMRDIEAALISNKGEFDSWGAYVSKVINGARVSWRALQMMMAGVGVFDAIEAGQDSVRRADEEQAVSGAMRGMKPVSPGLRGPGGPGGPGKTKARKDPAAEAAREDAKAVKLAQELETESVRFATGQIQQSYALRNITIDEYVAKMTKAAEDESAAVKEATDAQEAALAQKKNLTQQARENEQSVIDLARRKAGSKLTEAVDAIERQAAADRLALLRQTARDAEAIQFEADARTIARIENMEAQKRITHEAAASAINEIERSAAERRHQALDAELAAAEGNAAEVARIKQAIALLEEKEVSDREARERRTQEAIQQTTKDVQDEADAMEELADKVMAVARANIQVTATVTALDTALQQMGNGGLISMENFIAVMKESGMATAVMAGGLSVLNMAAQALAQGVGQMVNTWVLYGNTGGNSVRKMTAQILAGLAAQAAQMALMCLAYAAFSTTVIGAAMTGGTPAQFLQAAAFFGAVAVGAAIAGRVIAGDAFKDKGAAGGAMSGQAATAGGGGGSGRGGEYYSSKDNASSSQNRWNQIPPIDIRLNVKTDGGQIVRIVRDDVSNNGSLRQLILNTSGI